PPPRPVKKAKPPVQELEPDEPPPVPVDLENLPPEARAPLEKAFEIFGDHVVEVEEDGPV
ncbi:MAG: hypothetical protein IIZ87_05760, partial [Selenomonas sp.]|nr:hypothetical protein [Selenomonas sp.]